MGQPSRPLYKLGEYWIGTRKGSPNFYRVWWDTGTGRIRRSSLRTQDFGEAKKRLKDWFARTHHPDYKEPENVQLATVLSIYYEEHAMGLASHDAIRIALNLWLDYFGERSVADATTPQAIDGFSDWLLNGKRSANYVNKVLSAGGAAINRAYKRGLISRAPYIQPLPKGHVPVKGRPLSMDELRALYHATTMENLRRFILWMAGTVARPDAIFDLHRSQVDYKTGLIQLNPTGRVQTKKFRPTVKLPHALRGEFGDGEFLLMRAGKPIKSIRTAWRKVREEVGLDQTVQPYSIRHTMARHLRASGVPPWQVSAQLGHKQPGHSTTEIYAPFDPAYLSESVQVIEEFLQTLILSPLQMPITCSKHAQRSGLNRAHGAPNTLKNMVPPGGLEPPTSRSTI